MFEMLLIRGKLPREEGRRMFDIARQLIDVGCPRCGYLFEIQMLDASCQIYRRCPCCRARIHFVEPDGSMSRGIADVEESLRDLEHSLRRLR